MEDDENIEETENTIGELAFSCKSLFHQCLSKPSLVPMSLYIEELQQHFDAWASYLGVFASGHASLEYRLRFSVEIRIMVIELLDLLERNLERIIAPGSEHTIEVLDVLKGGVERLHRIGVAIRKSSTASLASRIKAFSETHDDEDYFYSLSYEIIKSKFTDANPGICKHLAASVKFRRQRLKYQWRHQQKLGQPRSYARNNESLKSKNPENVITKPKSPRATQAPTLSGTSASAFRPENFRKNLERTSMLQEPTTARPPPSVVSTGSTVVDHDKLPYPRAPVLEDGEQAVCDWCLRRHSALSYRDKVWWRRHILENLQPYVCLSEECKDPPKTFSKESEWREHMHDEHGMCWPREVYTPPQWCCDIGHSPLEYSTKQQLKDHLSETHSNMFTFDQRAIILEQSSLPCLRQSNVCPLCECVPEGFGKRLNAPSNSKEFLEEPQLDTLRKDAESSQRLKKVTFDSSLAENSETENSDAPNRNPTTLGLLSGELLELIELERHIANHLRSISFISIRNLTGDNGPSTNASAEAVDDKENGLSSNGSRNNDFDDAPLIFDDIPISESRSIVQSHTEGIGLGELITRFETAPIHDENQSVVSWKEFDWPGRNVNDQNDQRSLASKRDLEKRALQASDTGESEGKSPVIYVDDLGFSVAPAGSLPQFRDFYTRWMNSQGSLTVELFMNVDEMKVHLGGSKSSETTVEQLVGVEMERSFERSKQDDEEYLPRDAFEAIFDIQTIKALVREAYAEGTKRKWGALVAEIIRNSPSRGYRRILGVLVLMDRVPYIYDFMNEGITDYEFPIKRVSSDYKAFETRTGLYNARLFQNWTRNDIELLYVYQKKLFVPFFDIQEGQLCSYIFDSSVRLPWKDFEAKTSGGNVSVHRVEIHSQHHNFQSSNDREKPLYFALKEIFALDRDAYRRELRALETSTAHAHKENHLIKLLLTFQHGHTCYLLFEWADGNLAEFWEQPEVIPTPSDLWAVEQCLGISKAIERIHGLATWQKQLRSSHGSENDDEREWGRHGDIKPSNILWFSKYKVYSNETLHNHLVVSDIGLTRYRSSNTRSSVRKSHSEGYTSGYRPPEMDMGHLISSSYDIWSLGCVFLEFCVWYVNGGNSVQVFGIEREYEDKSEIRGVFEDKYFNVTTDEQGIKQASLKPIVETYLNTKLRESDRCTPFVEQMLNLIQCGMLVVDQKERWKIGKICAELHMLKTKISMTSSLGPPLEETHPIDATLEVANQELHDEGQPLGDSGISWVDQMAAPVRGNPGDILTESEQQQTVSVHSAGSGPNEFRGSRSPADDSFPGAEVPAHQITHTSQQSRERNIRTRMSRRFGTLREKVKQYIQRDNSES